MSSCANGPSGTLANALSASLPLLPQEKQIHATLPTSWSVLLQWMLFLFFTLRDNLLMILNFLVTIFFRRLLRHVPQHSQNSVLLLVAFQTLSICEGASDDVFLC